jgi:hypothetical protein
VKSASTPTSDAASAIVMRQRDRDRLIGAPSAEKARQRPVAHSPEPIA